MKQDSLPAIPEGALVRALATVPVTVTYFVKNGRTAVMMCMSFVTDVSIEINVQGLGQINFG